MKWFPVWMVQNFSVRSIVILLLLFGSVYLAIVDRDYRGQFSDLAKIGLGGYLGQLLPKEKG